MLPCVNLNNKGAGTYTYDVTEDMIITGTPEESTFRIYLPNDKECTVTLDNVDPDGSKSVELNGNMDQNMTVKLRGTSKLATLGNGGGTSSVTIEAVEAGSTVVVSNMGPALSGSPLTINSGTVKAKSTMMNAVVGGLVVNGGSVYLAGGYMSDDVPAVAGSITGSATLYGWDGSWGSITSDKRYITTDNTSGDPTTPSAAWTW